MRAAQDAWTELILETFRLNGRLLAAGDALVADAGLTSALAGARRDGLVPMAAARRPYRAQYGFDPAGRAASGKRNGTRRSRALRSQSTPSTGQAGAAHLHGKGGGL